MKWKPLLLTIPFLLLIGVMCYADAPSRAIQEEEDSTSFTLPLVVGKNGPQEEWKSAVVYQEPDQDSEPVAKLQYNCAVLAEKDQVNEEFIYVDLKGKGKGYVKKNEVDLDTIQVKVDDPLRMELLQNACSYLGLKFVRYGDSLEEGIDCSHFVSQIYAMSGKKIPDMPLKLREFGKKIGKEKALPGDLVYYDEANDGTGHVGMYLGSGYIINSSGHSGKKYPAGGVRICCLTYQDRESYFFLRVLK